MKLFKRSAKTTDSTESSANQARLIGAWRLLFSSLKQYGRNWKLLVLIAAIVTIPADLIQLAARGDNVIGAYVATVVLLMNLALIWTITKLEDDQPVKLSQAYYEGDSQIISFLLVSVVLALQLLPFVIGAAVFLNATTGGTVAATTGVRLLSGLVWLVLALPSAYWISGSLFSLFVVQDSTVRPLAAIKASGAAVKGRRWSVGGRLLALAVVLIIVLAVPSLGLALLQPSGWVTAGQSLLQAITSLTLLPISYIYFYKLYRALK